MGSDRTFMTTAEAAEYLGTSRGVIYWYARTGRLKRTDKESGARGRAQHLYLADDVHLLLKHKANKKQNSSLTQEALIRAARAESIANDTARRVDHLYSMLGLCYDAPDLTDEGLRAQHRSARAIVYDTVPVTLEEALDLARLVYRINEEQLRLLQVALSDPEPWVVYMQAMDVALRDVRELGSEEARACATYLVSAGRHLRGVAFEFVRAAYGHVRAEQMVEQTGGQVDEAIVAILMSDAIRR